MQTRDGPAAVSIDDADLSQLRLIVKDQQRRLQNLEDTEAINRLTRAYGYYVDKNLWDQVVNLFADDSSVELDQRGVFVGKNGVRRMFLENLGGGRVGMPRGRLFNHFQFQGIVTIAPDGRTAKGRWRTLAQVAGFRSIKHAWNEGVYENEYVKEGGVWKFSKLKFWSTYFTPYDQGWGGEQMIAVTGNGTSPGADRPSADGAPIFPEVYYPAFHYRNPVTGEAVDTDTLNAEARADRAARAKDAQPPKR